MVAGLEQRIKDLAGLWAERKAPLVEEVEELTKQIKGSAQVTCIRKPLLKYIKFRAQKCANFRCTNYLRGLLRLIYKPGDADHSLKVVLVQKMWLLSKRSEIRR